MSNDKASPWLAPGIAFAGVLVSATIGLAGWYNSSTQLKASTYNNFYGRTANEEAFWKGLYDDYLATFDERFEQRPEWRRRRLVAIFELSKSRKIPAFDEFDIELDRRTEWTDRLRELQASLYNGLDERAELDADLRSELVRRGFGRTSAPVDARPPAAVSQAAPPAAAPAPVITTQISAPAPVRRDISAPAADTPQVYSRVSGSGWDLDIFWCRGARQDENFRKAATLGAEFGRLAGEGRALAAGVRLGRVRARPASVAYQRQPGSPASRSWVVADSGMAEEQAAAAVRQSANVLLGGDVIGQATSVGAPTRWYLSMFICEPAP